MLNSVQIELLAYFPCFQKVILPGDQIISEKIQNYTELPSASLAEV